ncbi:hypothetical protein [Pseudomonas phage PA1C]|uniref:Uncharacterized protein n=1 Tax=Pseudomonas phage vB_PaeM_PS119XW TaxID=2601632 RepID=A0A5C1K8M7_9CAUD|nr:hypothetical protein PP933_gp122 [Pseudomonas phage vB_PaeM_PS119XW]QBX32277.1 hypothetical protein [Pseudomonas phage PA1C]QEM41851.1 hypothetical protein [Pseudomonas phage vB_PaeM_PS119XW]
MNQVLKEMAIGLGVALAVAGVMIGTDIVAKSLNDKILFADFSKRLDVLIQEARKAAIENDTAARLRFSQGLLSLRIKMAIEMRDRDGEYKAAFDVRIDEFKSEMGWG